MTIAPHFWVRSHLRHPGVERVFKVDADAALLAWCHWQPNRRQRPTVVVLHGLEGSSDSHYVIGITRKALHLGMNVLRMNMRNCGGKLDLCPGLYNSGMSGDVIAVLKELTEVEQLSSIFLVGYSMGGNIVLKAAAELSVNPYPAIPLSGVCAVSPALDLASCIARIEQGFNRFYERRFLMSLKAKIRAKHRLFPKAYRLDLLNHVGSLRDFDNLFTAPDAGYLSADDYYEKASALPLIQNIQVPSLIITSQDDPIVPFESVHAATLGNPNVMMLAPKFGGHAAFLQHQAEEPSIFDCFWAENRAVQFCLTTTSQVLSPWHNRRERAK